MKTRRRARVIALQTLFEIDSVGHKPAQVLAERLKTGALPEDGRSLCQDLVRGVQCKTEELDDIIHLLAPEWPVAQMGIIDRNILRMSIYEMASQSDTPVKAVANEAVELAKLFGSDSSRRFINGVLGTLISQLEAREGDLGHFLNKLSLPPKVSTKRVREEENTAV